MPQRYIGRANVRKRLERLDGTPGRTVYAAGEARIEAENETIVARPPFGLGHEGEYDMVRLSPLPREGSSLVRLPGADITPERCRGRPLPRRSPGAVSGG